MLYAVEGYEFCTFGLRAYYDLMSGYHVGVEAVHRLPVGHHDIIGNIHDVVDGSEADDLKLLFQPVWTFLHVACHTIVAQRVSSVGGDVDVDHPVAFQMVVFGSRCSDNSVVGQYDDATMVVAHANLVLSTDHTEGVDAAKAAFLDGEFLVTVIQHTAEVGHDHLLSGSHIGRTAYDLLWFTFAKVDGCHMQMVAIGMGLTCKHLTYKQSLQSALDGLNFIQRIHLKTCRGQRVRCLLRGEVEVNILFKPLI